MTYQKPNIQGYGALPSMTQVSHDSLSSAEGQATTNQSSSKRTMGKSLLVKAAVLGATLVAGVLVGSALSGDSQNWTEEEKQPTVVAATEHVPVPCDNEKADTEADVWTKIKQESTSTSVGLSLTVNTAPLVQCHSSLFFATQLKVLSTVLLRPMMAAVRTLVTAFFATWEAMPSMPLWPLLCAWVL
jgi:hypothetical protein